MGGRSGSVVARHTPILSHGGNHYTISPAQMRIVKRALEHKGACYVKGVEVRSAQKLVDGGYGMLTDDGSFGPKQGASNTDGERWTFKLAEGVSIP